MKDSWCLLPSSDCAAFCSCGFPVTPPDSLSPSPVLDAELRVTLAALETRVSILQEHVTQLTAALLRERDLRFQQLLGVSQPLTPVASSVPLVPPQHEAPPLAQPRVIPSPPPSPAPLKPLPRHPHPPVIPLIETRADGTVVVICPQRGLLPLVPDSPRWFDWLASLPSFRFSDQQGRFGVQRKTIGGLPTREWRTYVHFHNRQHTFYLGMTEYLTVAHLEQMAATIRARLATL